MSETELNLLKRIIDKQGKMMVDVNDVEDMLIAYKFKEKNYIDIKPMHRNVVQISLREEGCIPTRDAINSHIEYLTKKREELKKYKDDWVGTMRETINDMIYEDRKSLDKLKQIKVCGGVLK